MDEKGVPSIEFGAWHTHADLWDSDPRRGVARMLDYLEQISDGTVLLKESPTVGDGLPFCVVDVSSRDELLDEVTSPGAPPSIRLLSWSGAEDRILDVDAVGPSNGGPA